MKPVVRFATSPTGGASHSVAPDKDWSALAELIDFGASSHALARFCIDELKSVNARLLKELDNRDVASRLKAERLGLGSDFWGARRADLFNYVKDWWRVVTGPVEPRIESAELRESARECPGCAFFHPLRRELTGHEDGAAMNWLLPFIGQEKAATRLIGQTA